MYQHYEILTCYYIGAVFNALLLAEMSGIIMSMGMAERAFTDRMRQVEDYMRSKDLSTEMKDMVRDFFKARYGGRIFDEDDLLNELTPALKRNILNYTSTEILNLVPFIRDTLSESMRSQIASCLHAQIFMDGTNVIEEGTNGDAIYLIQTGIVEVSVGAKLTLKPTPCALHPVPYALTADNCRERFQIPPGTEKSLRGPRFLPGEICRSREGFGWHPNIAPGKSLPFGLRNYRLSLNA